MREGNIQYAHGKPIIGSEITLAVKCNVQPMNARDLLLVPEGDRFKEQYWIFADPGTTLLINDRVVRDGANYQVQSVELWGSYQRVRIMRVDVGPERTP